MTARSSARFWKSWSLRIKRALALGVDERHLADDDHVLELLSDVDGRVRAVVVELGEEVGRGLAVELGIALGRELDVAVLAEVRGVALGHLVDLDVVRLADLVGVGLLHDDHGGVAQERDREGLGRAVAPRTVDRVGDEAEGTVLVALLGETGDVLGLPDLVEVAFAGGGVGEARLEEREQVEAVTHWVLRRLVPVAGPAGLAAAAGRNMPDGKKLVKH